MIRKKILLHIEFIIMLILIGTGLTFIFFNVFDSSFQKSDIETPPSSNTQTQMPVVFEGEDGKKYMSLPDPNEMQDDGSVYEIKNGEVRKLSQEEAEKEGSFSYYEQSLLEKSMGDPCSFIRQSNLPYTADELAEDLQSEEFARIKDEKSYCAAKISFLLSLQKVAENIGDSYELSPKYHFDYLTRYIGKERAIQVMVLMDDYYNNFHNDIDAFKKLIGY